jgi:photosystem II P680 reaction center D1 protein
MNTITQRRAELDVAKYWDGFCDWITSTENRIYIGWFGVLAIPTLCAAAICFAIAFIAAPSVDIDGVREPVIGSLMGGNNIITAAVVPTSAAIGLHFYPIWAAGSLDEWLYNGGPYQINCAAFPDWNLVLPGANVGTQLPLRDAPLDCCGFQCASWRRDISIASLSHRSR